jgi:hypothetical protein
VNSLARFVHLPVAERVLLVRAFAWVLFFRALLPFAPLAALLRISNGPVRARAASGSSSVAWAVRAAANRIPGARCLARSLALQALLRRAGHESSVNIGVRRGGAGFEAHAWVTCEGRTIDDEPGTGAYAAFDPLPR